MIRDNKEAADTEEDEEPLLDVGSPVDLSRIPRLVEYSTSGHQDGDSPPPQPRPQALPFSVDNILDPNKFTGNKLTSHHWRPHEITHSSKYPYLFSMTHIFLSNSNSCQ